MAGEAMIRAARRHPPPSLLAVAPTVTYPPSPFRLSKSRVSALPSLLSPRELV